MRFECEIKCSFGFLDSFGFDKVQRKVFFGMSIVLGIFVEEVLI